MQRLHQDRIEPSEKDIRDALKNARMQSDSTISKVAPYLQDILVKVKYVPIDAAASFVQKAYNTAYEIDSYGVMPEEGKRLMILIWSFKYVVTKAWSQLYRTEPKFCSQNRRRFGKASQSCEYCVWENAFSQRY